SLPAVDAVSPTVADSKRWASFATTSAAFETLRFPVRLPWRTALKRLRSVRDMASSLRAHADDGVAPRSQADDLQVREHSQFEAVRPLLAVEREAGASFHHREIAGARDVPGVELQAVHLARRHARVAEDLHLPRGPLELDPVDGLAEDVAPDARGRLLDGLDVPGRLELEHERLQVRRVVEGVRRVARMPHGLSNEAHARLLRRESRPVDADAREAERIARAVAREERVGRPRVGEGDPRANALQDVAVVAVPHEVVADLQ